MNETSPATVDQLLTALTSKQHLSPHATLRQALARVIAELGVCAQAVEQSLAWLQLDADKSIGRLRRTELMQLARTIHRICNQRHADVATMTS